MGGVHKCMFLNVLDLRKIVHNCGIKFHATKVCLLRDNTKEKFSVRLVIFRKDNLITSNGYDL